MSFLVVSPRPGFLSKSSRPGTGLFFASAPCISVKKTLFKSLNLLHFFFLSVLSSVELLCYCATVH
jgi:hypothetical protein